MLRRLEVGLERTLYASRWLLAPLYAGLVAGLLIVLIKFGEKFWKLVTHVADLDQHEVVLQVLGLLDLTLLANLVLIVIFSGYENFVSKIAIARGSEDKPYWMGRVDFSGLKIKLIGSLVAISVIELLKDFMQADTMDKTTILWRVILHMTFVLSGVLFAFMDSLADRHKPHVSEGD